MSFKLSRSIFRLTSARCSILNSALVLNKCNVHQITTISAKNYNLAINSSKLYCTSAYTAATYEEVKSLPDHPEKLLIDVREPHELQETGVIPTAINIPLKQVAEKLSKEFSNENFLKLYNRDKPSASTEIIFHCKIGKRSQDAADLALKLGYKNVKNYKGSWEEWKVKEGLSK